jgi:hypothetical protein
MAAATPARAQGLLDQELGPKPAPAASDKTDKPDAKPAEPTGARPAAPAPDKPPATPAAAPNALDPNPEIVSPDAARKVDDQDLIRELTQPGSDKPDPQKIDERMKEMLSRMHDSAKMLTTGDPGDVTQETQRRIVTDLDVMIALAKQQQQQGKSSQQPNPQQQPGDKRQQTQGNQGGPHQEGGNVAATSDNSGGGQDAAVTGDMRNTGAANWGGLPPRDRDEISHGANEEYLAGYKTMIDKYYQALAEMGKTRGR